MKSMGLQFVIMSQACYVEVLSPSFSLFFLALRVIIISNTVGEYIRSEFG